MVLWHAKLCNHPVCNTSYTYANDRHLGYIRLVPAVLQLVLQQCVALSRLEPEKACASHVLSWSMALWMNQANVFRALDFDQPNRNCSVRVLQSTRQRPVECTIRVLKRVLQITVYTLVSCMPMTSAHISIISFVELQRDNTKVLNANVANQCRQYTVAYRIYTARHYKIVRTCKNIML